MAVDAAGMALASDEFSTDLLANTPTGKPASFDGSRTGSVVECSQAVLATPRFMRIIQTTTRLNPMSTTEKQSGSKEAVDLGGSTPAPIVLVVSWHSDFAEAVSKHLFDIGISVHSRTLRAAVGVEMLREMRPNIAFVDWDVQTPDNVMFYQTLAVAVPDCRIIILCSREQAPYAAQSIRDGETFDYLLIDSEPDPNRLRLYLERAQLECILPKPAEIRGLVKRHNRRAMELLKEIKDILKSDLSSPVVKAIHDFDNSTDGQSGEDDSAHADLAEKYRNNVVDFLCGKLRRLESEMCSHGKKHATDDGKSNGAVLIVEDDIVSAELARRILERNGYDAVVAKTDDEAISELSKRRFQLVLMDVHLGTGDGLRVVRMMRARTDLQVIPVIVITSDRQRDTLFEAAELQVQGYLLKPYHPKELIHKVKSAISKQPESKPRSAQIATKA
jgi:CheY-like chemotaxis protein